MPAERRCGRCKKRLNSNAFPKFSSRCYPCHESAKPKRAEMPSILADLRGRMTELERDSDWEYRFVSDLVERWESGKIDYLTPKQFAKLEEIYRKYD